VEREAERQPFARARSYLSYSPVAKWSALVAAAGTGLLYVALLIALWLFTELVIHHGALPTFADLSPQRQGEFLGQWNNLPQQTRLERLTELGLEPGPAEALAGTETESLLPPQREIIWESDLHQSLRKRVDGAAASVVAYDNEGRDLSDRGILSLVVRSRSPWAAAVAGWLAHQNPWMWQFRSANHPNFFYYLTGLLLVALVLALARAVLMFIGDEMAARASIEATSRMRRAVYHHTYRLGTLAIKALGPSEAVTIFTRYIEAVHDALYVWLTTVFREPIKFALLVLLALVIHPILAVVFLLSALLVWLIGGQLATYYRRQGRAAASRAAEQLTLLRESLMLMRLVKVYLMELFNQSRVERLLSRHAEAQLYRYRGDAIYKPLLIFLATLVAIVMLYAGGLIVLHDQLGVSSAIILATALVSLYWPLTAWLRHRKELRRGREAAVHVFRFLSRPGEVGQVVGAEFLPPTAKQLEFDNVTLREPGTNRLLLQDVSLSIPAGQRVALISADDMEKHAFVYLIPRFLDPTSGEIRIDEHNLRWVTLDSLRNQIALVLQHNLVFHDTVANNIGCGDTAYTLPQIIEAAKVAHAHQFIQKLPKGYETTIGELGHSLSVGEQFRIALARAILRDPAILIVEEPEKALDDETKALLDDTFARVLPGLTVIFLPSRVSTIRSCDQIFLLHKGKLEAAGVHRELLANNPLYRHLHYITFSEMAEQV
jgi:ATP-binding cassette subfamily B protein